MILPPPNFFFGFEVITGGEFAPDAFDWGKSWKAGGIGERSDCGEIVDTELFV